MSDNAKIPLHQWTHDTGRVLLVKWVPKGGLGHGGFQYPREGKVRCPKAAANRDGAATVTGNHSCDCASGGLFAWAWGVNLGIGREPDYRGDWLVLAAAPADIVDLKGKAKIVGEAEVVYYGDALGAMMYTLAGRVAWVEHNAAGSAAATGGSGSAAATGWSGSAAATGERGSAAATGERGSAAATGERGSAAATGGKAIAALTGEYGTLTVGPHALGAVTARRWTWEVRAGAVVACRWQDDAEAWHHALLLADQLGLKEGQRVEVKDGQVQSPAEA